MLIENEIKLRIPNSMTAERVLRRCRSLYALTSDWCLHRDTYYDTSGGFLREDDLTLRLREVAGEAVAAVKGPRKRRSSGEYYRFEVEIPVADAAQMRASLTTDGFMPQTVIEKRRIEFARGETARISLDELPYIGCFMEIEGTSDEISAVRRELRVVSLRPVRENYTELLERHFGIGAGRGHSLQAVFGDGE